MRGGRKLWVGMVFSFSLPEALIVSRFFLSASAKVSAKQRLTVCLLSSVFDAMFSFERSFDFLFCPCLNGAFDQQGKLI